MRNIIEFIISCQSNRCIYLRNACIIHVISNYIRFFNRRAQIDIWSLAGCSLVDWDWEDRQRGIILHFEQHCDHIHYPSVCVRPISRGIKHIAVY